MARYCVISDKGYKGHGTPTRTWFDEEEKAAAYAEQLMLNQDPGTILLVVKEVIQVERMPPNPPPCRRNYISS